MTKITFTLREIRRHNRSKERWQTLWKGLGGIKKYGEDTPITLRQLYEIIGHQSIVWCLRTTPPETHNLWQHFDIDCARMVEHLMEDQRKINVLDDARRNADGQETDEELDFSDWDVTIWDAPFWHSFGNDAMAAASAAAVAVMAARSSSVVPCSAASMASEAAAWSYAAWSADPSASEAAEAARAVAMDIALGAAQDAQIDLLEIYCEHGKRPENSEQLLKDLYKKRLEEKNNE